MGGRGIDSNAAKHCPQSSRGASGLVVGPVATCRSRRGNIGDLSTHIAMLWSRPGTGRGGGEVRRKTREA
eukprot:8029201-Pyramimonas_sp.AAC.1